MTWKFKYAWYKKYSRYDVKLKECPQYVEGALYDYVNDRNHFLTEYEYNMAHVLRRMFIENKILWWFYRPYERKLTGCGMYTPPFHLMTSDFHELVIHPVKGYGSKTEKGVRMRDLKKYYKIRASITKFCCLYKKDIEFLCRWFNLEYIEDR